MKKFISMVMAAAMVVSLVPATAFAANEATFKVVGDEEYTVEAAEEMLSDKDADGKEKALGYIEGPEVQIKIVDFDQKDTNKGAGDGEESGYEITLDFEGAEFYKDVENDVVFTEDVDTIPARLGGKDITLLVTEEVENEDSSITLELAADAALAEDAILAINVSDLKLILTGDNAGHEATVTVGGDFGDSDAMVFAAVLKEGLDVTLKKVADVAVEETTPLKRDLTIETAVGKFCGDQVLELVLSKGFEFEKLDDTGATGWEYLNMDENEAWIKVTTNTSKVVIDADALEIEAVDAEAGDVCTITVKAKDHYEDTKVELNGCDNCIKATAEAVDAVKVVSDSVILSVDEDEDVPVMYSGVDLAETGLTSEEDHTSLEITIEESVAEAWDLKKAFTLSLPEGVYVATDKDHEGVNVVEPGNLLVRGVADSDEDDIVAEFAEAYNDGDYKLFDFSRKTFEAAKEGDDYKAIEFVFTLDLVADAGFVGDVVLTMDYEGETQEVVIAKFVTPMVVEAASNDVIIDYRNTEVPTDIVVKEAEAGLWADGLQVGFYVDEPVSSIVFEDDFTVEADEASEMEIDSFEEDGLMKFEVTEKSDEEAAVITISDIELYMSRSVPAGAYDLGMYYGKEIVIDDKGTTTVYNDYLYTDLFGKETGENAKYVDINDVTDMDGIVKEGWINVITAGRDQDDASFTKKIVVTIGADTLVAGEETVSLPVPAYINAAGRTMLPVRAVAVALGINTNNVIWDQPTKTVTILYGQRIITMQVGSSVITVNGSAIPASAAVEVVDGRTFLGFRDLATALGVTDIVWTAETQQVTMNGNR